MKEDSELAEGDRLVAPQDLAQLRRAAAGGAAREHRLDLRRGRAMEHPGLVAGSCQGLEGERGRQVGKCPRDRGHRNAGPGGRVDRIEPAAAPDIEARYPAFGGYQHLRRRRPSLYQPPQVSRSTAAEERPRPARLHRRHVAGLAVGSTVPDSIDTPVLGNQQALAHPSFDHPRAQPRGQELPSRDDAVLRARDPGECPLRCPVFTTHTVVKAGRRPSSPPLTRATDSSVNRSGMIPAASG